MPSFLRCPGPGKHEVPSIWITNDHQKGTSVFCALVLLASRRVKICTRTEESTTTFTRTGSFSLRSPIFQCRQRPHDVPTTCATAPHGPPWPLARRSAPELCGVRHRHAVLPRGPNPGGRGPPGRRKTRTGESTCIKTKRIKWANIHRFGTWLCKEPVLGT